MAKRVRYTYTAHSWMFELSFWVVIVIGAALVAAGIFNAIGVWFLKDPANWAITVCYWIKNICVGLGMIVPVVMSYQVARYKSKAWLIVWIVFVIFVVVGVILSAF